MYAMIPNTIPVKSEINIQSILTTTGSKLVYSPIPAQTPAKTLLCLDLYNLFTCFAIIYALLNLSVTLSQLIIPKNFSICSGLLFL